MLPKAAAALLNDQASVGLLLYAVSTIFAAGMNTCAKLLSRSSSRAYHIGMPLVTAAGSCTAGPLLLSLPTTKQKHSSILAKKLELHQESRAGRSLIYRQLVL